MDAREGHRNDGERATYRRDDPRHDAVVQAPLIGRVKFGAVLGMNDPEIPVLSLRARLPLRGRLMELVKRAPALSAECIDRRVESRTAVGTGLFHVRSDAERARSPAGPRG